MSDYIIGRKPTISKKLIFLPFFSGSFLEPGMNQLIIFKKCYLADVKMPPKHVQVVAESLIELHCAIMNTAPMAKLTSGQTD